PPRRPSRSTLFPYTNALPISPGGGRMMRVRAAARVVAVLTMLAGLAGCGPSSRAPTAASSPNAPAFEDCPAMVKVGKPVFFQDRSEEHTSELQSRSDLVCRLL